MRAAHVAATLVLALSTGWAGAGDSAPPPRMASTAAWSLRLPQEQKLDFSGVVSMDKAGTGTGHMLYPAIDPISFLVSIAVHAAINESVKSHQKSKIQQEADRVLEPYKPVLDTITPREVMTKGLALSTAGSSRKLVETGTPAGSGWLLDSKPTFAMTQDQQALVLDNVVTLYAPDNASAPVYANSVHVVSAPRVAADHAAMWMEHGGAALKSEAAALLAESMDMFLREAGAATTSDAEAKFKTVRYQEGGSEKMERAQVVGVTCQRLRLKTLRGWLMSVPAGTTCPAAPAASPQTTALAVPSN